MTQICVKNLGKAFRSYSPEWRRFARWLGISTIPNEEHWVLRSVNFEIQKGEAIGIIGQNGAGKSTLLKMITDTLQPTEGEIQVNGRIAAILELGMGFNPDLTGRQNVSYSAGLMGFSADVIQQAMPDIEGFADIGVYFDQPVRMYSSGMQMRVAFSVATNFRPEILIVDEALAVGDVFFQQKCFDRIKEYCNLGMTLLFVSHALESIFALCNRAILLEEGRIVLDGKPKDVIDIYNARQIQLANPISTPINIVSKEGNLKEGAKVNDAFNKDANSTRNQPLVIKDTAVGSYYSTKVDIVDVSLLLDGQKTECFISESQVTVRIKVKFLRKCLDPHIGFQVRSTRGDVIFMTNTHAMNSSIGLASEGSIIIVDFIFKAVLAEGEYTLTVGVANEGTLGGKFNYALSRVQNALSFVVLRNVEGIRWSGVCNLMPKCVIETSFD